MLVSQVEVVFVGDVQNGQEAQGWTDRPLLPGELGIDGSKARKTVIEDVLLYSLLYLLYQGLLVPCYCLVAYAQ